MKAVSNVVSTSSRGAAHVELTKGAVEVAVMFVLLLDRVSEELGKGVDSMVELVLDDRSFAVVEIETCRLYREV